MSEMHAKTLAVPADERLVCCGCVQADRKNRQHSSGGMLSWYFAERGMPGMVYAATIYGYMASGPDKTKGGKEDV